MRGTTSLELYSVEEVFDFTEWATKSFNMERDEKLCVLLHLETSSGLHMCVLHYSGHLQVLWYNMQRIFIFFRSHIFVQI